MRYWLMCKKLIQYLLEPKFIHGFYADKKLTPSVRNPTETKWSSNGKPISIVL